jgi:ESCRT-I complex subunit TSG101
MQASLEPFLQTYANAARIRQDIGVLRSRFPNLQATGDTFVTNQGRVLELLKFVGTVPIVYKGQTYHIPLTVWIPISYPFEGPNIYVSPTSDMAIKPRHQHVDAEGKCYLPALSAWNAQHGNLAAVVGELQGVFAVNPPVFAKPKDQPSVKPPSNPYGVGSPPEVRSPVASNPTPAAYDYRGHPPPSNSGSNNNNAKLETLRRQSTELVQRECRKIAEEAAQFMTTQVLLENGMGEIDEALVKMQEHKRQLQLAIEWTLKANADLDNWHAARADGATAAPVNVDEIVVPTSPVAAQLLNAVASNKAIEDALYVLNRALQSEDVKMDCDTFAKEHRKLCSAQFMHLALVRKIHQSGLLKQ